MDITRREFLQWTLVTGAAVTLAGCATPPHQALVSQLELPEYRLPGEARWYASACQECASGCGVSVRVIDGRAKKIEGIPEHPVNHGKLCAKGHSALQALYHPERLTSVTRRGGQSSGWDDAVKALGSQLDAAAAKKGSMLWITRSLHGTQGAVMAALAERAGAKLWVLEFPGTVSQRAAMKSLVGKAELPYYPIQEADYIVNFGSDFLFTGNSPVHDAWAYGEFRQGKKRDRRGTLVSFSPRMNLTDSNSDKWIPVRPGSEGWVAAVLASLVNPSNRLSVPLETVSKITGVERDTFERLAERLRRAQRPLAIAGAQNGAYSNGVWNIAMIQTLNRTLSGKLESFEPDLLTQISGMKPSANLFVSTQEAIAGLEQGKFETIWVLDGNPRYLLPKKINFEALFSKAKNKVVFSNYVNETTLLADWVLPTQTWLESWGDRLIRGPFGEKSEVASVYNLQQPVVIGRDGTMSVPDILLMAAGKSSLNGGLGENLHAVLKSHFSDESEWENSLLRGGAWEPFSIEWEAYLGKNTHPLYPPPTVKKEAKAPSGINIWELLKKSSVADSGEAKFSGEGKVLIPFVSNLGDGSLANRPWMQELRDPLTTTVWTHWVELSYSVAKELGVERGDMVRLTSANGTLTGPAYPNIALHPDAVAVPVGQGHFSYGMYANRGENPLSILDPVWQEGTGELAWVGTRVKVEKTGDKGRLITFDNRWDSYPKEFMPL